MDVEADRVRADSLTRAAEPRRRGAVGWRLEDETRRDEMSCWALGLDRNDRYPHTAWMAGLLAGWHDGRNETKTSASSSLRFNLDGRRPWRVLSFCLHGLGAVWWFAFRTLCASSV